MNDQHPSGGTPGPLPSDLPLSGEEFFRCSLGMVVVVTQILEMPLAEMVETIERIEKHGPMPGIEELARAAGTDAATAYAHQARVASALLGVKNVVTEHHSARHSGPKGQGS